MKHLAWLLASLVPFTIPASAADNLATIKRELETLKSRVTALEQENAQLKKQIDVDRLIVRKELIVSDTGEPWEAGFEQHQIARGIYARSVTDDKVGGLWVRSRLIKGEIDDPFDDRFHALEREGRWRGNPGHISWNVWLDDAWRQVAIIQGEGLELFEMPREKWSGGNHPGRLRFQTFRPYHEEPLTDAIIGQGMMSLGGGGFGGSGMPTPSEVLQLWGGKLLEQPTATPAAPAVIDDDGTGQHEYAIIAIGPQGDRTAPSPAIKANGHAHLQWDQAIGADAYIILRDGQEITGPLRIEGSQKNWTDKPSP